MSRLVVHIGLEKTGSTYLQAFLRANVDYLAEQGVGCPDLWRGGEHLNFLMAGQPDIGWMQRRYEIRSPAQLDDLRREVHGKLEEMASTYPTTIITSERLSVERDRGTIANYAAMCREHFDDVEVVAYFRRPDHAVGSYYGQSIKVGRTSRDVDDFMSTQGRSLDIAAILKRWRAEFGAESFYAWPYLERYKTGGDTALSVPLRHLGLTPPTPEEPGGWQRPERNLNVRLSGEATEYVRLLNPRVPRVRIDGRWNGKQRNMMVREVAERFPGKDAAAPPEILDAIAEAYSPKKFVKLARRDDDVDAALWDEWLAQPPATGEIPPTITDEQVAALAEEIFAPRGPVTPDGAVPAPKPKPEPKPKPAPKPAPKPKPKPTLLGRARRTAAKAKRRLLG